MSRVLGGDVDIGLGVSVDVCVGGVGVRVVGSVVVRVHARLGVVVVVVGGG